MAGGKCAALRALWNWSRTSERLALEPVRRPRHRLDASPARFALRPEVILFEQPCSALYSDFAAVEDLSRKLG